MVNLTRGRRRLGVNDLELLESLFASLDQSPFYVKDAELRYRAANHAMAQLCGVASARDMFGKTARQFYPQPDADRFERIERAVLHTGEPSVTMLDFIPGHQPAWLVFSNHPLFDADGTPIGVAGTSTRLERRHVEDQIYQRLLVVSERLQADPAALLDVRSLAADASTSVSQLQRDFRNVFGMTLRQFLAQLRLAKARELLLTDLPIAGIAHEVGFTDHSAFSRRFRAEFGVTPSDFRKSVRSVRFA